MMRETFLGSGTVGVTEGENGGRLRNINLVLTVV